MDYQPPIEAIREIENKLDIIQTMPTLQFEQIVSSLNLPEIISSSSVSKACGHSLSVLLGAIENHGEMWALQMVDADGKIGSGFFQGNTLWLGRYSECKDSSVRAKSNGTAFYVVDFGVSINVSGVPPTILAAKQGMCFPESCNMADVSSLANQTILQLETVLEKNNLDMLHLYYGAVEDVSKDKFLLLDGSSAWRFCVLLVFITAVVGATFLDILGFGETSDKNTTEQLDTEGNTQNAVKTRLLHITTDDTESETYSVEEGTKENNDKTSYEENTTSLVGNQLNAAIELENQDSRNAETKVNLNESIEVNQDNEVNSKDTKDTEQNILCGKKEFDTIIEEEHEDNLEHVEENKIITIQVETHKEVNNNVITENTTDEKDNKSSSNPKKKTDEVTIEKNKGSMLQVLSDKGYKSLAENTLGEMGLDHMDGNNTDKNGSDKKEKRDVKRLKERAKSLEVLKAEDEFSESPSLRSFRKIANHSRNFNNILKKFKSFENIEEHGTVSGRTPLESNQEGLKPHAESLAIKVVETGDENIIGDEVDEISWKEIIQPQETNHKMTYLGNPTSIPNEDKINIDTVEKVDEIDGLNNEEKTHQNNEQQNTNEEDDTNEMNDGEDEIDGIYPEIIIESEPNANNLQAEDLQNSTNCLVYKELESSNVEDSDKNKTDEHQIMDEEKVDTINEDFIQKTSWPNRLGTMAEIFANEESLERCIENENLDQTQEMQVIKMPRTKTLSFQNCVKAFSALRNLKKICNITDSNEELSCLHGIRFLSMTWVILGHTFFFAMSYVDNPAWALEKIQNTKSMEAVEQGTFSVDSFFFLSGLLVSYMFLTRRNQIKSLNFLFWLKFIFHRFIRILPPYLALIVLLEPLMYYTCDGPLCPTKNNSNCYKYWWTNLLNINNFWSESDMCAGWTWYLANDFQFFCLSPIFLLLLVYIQPLAWVSITLIAKGAS